jgi:hypothetical protein
MPPRPRPPQDGRGVAVHRRDHDAGGAVRPRRGFPRRAGKVRCSCESLLSHAQAGELPSVCYVVSFEGFIRLAVQAGTLGVGRARVSVRRNAGLVSRPRKSGGPGIWPWLHWRPASRRVQICCARKRESSIRMRVLRFTCAADVRRMGIRLAISRPTFLFFQRLELCRSAGNSMQLLQDRASVTAFLRQAQARRQPQYPQGRT